MKTNYAQRNSITSPRPAKKRRRFSVAFFIPTIGSFQVVVVASDTLRFFKKLELGEREGYHRIRCQFKLFSSFHMNNSIVAWLIMCR